MEFLRVCGKWLTCKHHQAKQVLAFPWIFGGSLHCSDDNGDRDGGKQRQMKRRGDDGSCSIKMDVEGKKLCKQSKGESFSVSKIWLWHKKGKCTSSSDVNGGGSETEVTWEDQQNINKFGRLNNRFHELEDEIKTAKVTVYRLICKETVEENILQRASQKNTVQQLVMTGGHVQGDILAPEDVVSLLLNVAQLEQKLREASQHMMYRTVKSTDKGAGQRQTDMAMNQRTGIAELEKGLSCEKPEKNSSHSLMNPSSPPISPRFSTSLFLQSLLGRWMLSQLSDSNLVQAIHYFVQAKQDS